MTKNSAGKSGSRTRKVLSDFRFSTENRHGDHLNTTQSLPAPRAQDVPPQANAANLAHATDAPVVGSISSRIAKADSFIEPIPKLTKAIGLFGSACGFVYLLAYTRHIGIPFPLELGVLPTLLLIVGVAGVLGISILVGGVMIPALIADDQSGAMRTYLVAKDVAGKPLEVRVLRYLVSMWTPMVAALAALLVAMDMFGDAEWMTALSVGLLFFAVVWIFFTPFVVPSLKGKRVEYIFPVLVHTMLSVWSYCLTILLALIAYPAINELPMLQACLILLVIFSVVHALITVPILKRAPGQVGLAGQAEQAGAPSREQREAASPATAVFVLASLVIALTVINYPLNAKVGKSVLLVFGIGGGLPAIVCLEKAPPADVIKRINFQSECSDPMEILFDAGDKLYVTKKSPEGSRPSDAFLAISEPVYFRQDDIRQIIYLPTAPKKPKVDKPAQP